MNFQSANALNVRMNKISGNLLPMTADGTSFSMFWRIYSVLMWLLQVIMLVALILGCIYVPKEKALQDGLSCLAVSVEMFFMATRFYSCKDVVNRLIRRLNDILSTADNTMKNIVITNLQPIQVPLTFYCFAGTISVIAYNCISLMLLFEKDVFWYQDYTYPVAFFSQPLSPRTYLLGSFILLIGSVYITLKKAGLDIYLVHMVLMTTAQYQYTAVKLAMILQNRNGNINCESGRMNSSEWKETELKALCRHHNALLHITFLLKQTLSLTCSIIYVSCILRYCFFGVMISFLITSSLWGEALIVIMYSSGAIVQLYILCFCVQRLLDASTEVTNEAFHQEWYLYGSSVKNIFMLLITANNLECKLATFENFSLILPSFMKILNQAYTVALLFLRMK